MKVLSLDEQANKRRLHNKEILHKMSRGESLNRFDSQKSWFPPRPIIKKDQVGMKKLYASQKPMQNILAKANSNPSNLLFFKN